jgi:hypothetical protein
MRGRVVHLCITKENVGILQASPQSHTKMNHKQLRNIICKSIYAGTSGVTVLRSYAKSLHLNIVELHQEQPSFTDLHVAKSKESKVPVKFWYVVEYYRSSSSFFFSRERRMEIDGTFVIGAQPFLFHHKQFSSSPTLQKDHMPILVASYKLARTSRLIHEATPHIQRHVAAYTYTNLTQLREARERRNCRLRHALHRCAHRRHCACCA